MKDGLNYTSFRTNLREELADNFSLEDIGVGLLLAMFCAEKMNGGIILGAKNWTEIDWILKVHLGRQLTENRPGLWRWDCDNLIVDLYDKEVEKKIISRQRNNVSAARRRWGFNANAYACAHANAYANASKTEQADEKSQNDLKENNLEEESTENVMHMHMHSHNENGDSANSLNSNDKASRARAALHRSIPYNKFSEADNKLNIGINTTVDNILIRKDTITARTRTRDMLPEFTSWIASLSSCISWLASYRILPAKVEKAARDAWQSIPNAISDAELIGAYYDSDMAQDKYGRFFWRPVGVLFFDEMMTVIENAHRWARETRWKPAKVRAARKAKKPQPMSKEEEEIDKQKRIEAAENFKKMVRELEQENENAPTSDEMPSKNAPNDAPA